MSSSILNTTKLSNTNNKSKVSLTTKNRNKYIPDIILNEDSYINDSEYKFELLDDCYIYSWGKNNNGELGNGSITDFEMFVSPAKSSIAATINQDNTNNFQMSIGGKHTILVINNEVYSCGSDLLGVSGGGIHSLNWSNKSNFNKLEIFDGKGIVKVKCAEFHSLALSSDGKVYAWGGNLYNKLGTPSDRGFPVLVRPLMKKIITDIAIGDHHSVALTNTGSVYSWGGGGSSYNKGQCGHGDAVDRIIPTKIAYFSDKYVTHIACGGYHTIIATKENVPKFDFNMQSNILENSKVSNRRISYSHSKNKSFKNKDSNKKLDLTKNINESTEYKQCLYGVGAGEYGQCGYGISEDTHTPKKIRFNYQIINYIIKNLIEENKIQNNSDNSQNMIDKSYLEDSNIISNKIINQNNNINDNINLTIKSCLYKEDNMFDLTNSYYEGTNNNLLKYKSTIDKYITVKKISCGGNHSIFLTEAGCIFTFGQNFSGQLGLGNTDNYFSPIIVSSFNNKTVIDIEAGWSHSLAYTSQGFLYSTGCGKFGELGHRSLDNKKVFTLIEDTKLLNIKDLREKTGIFAGGHHSFIYLDKNAPLKDANLTKMPSPLKKCNLIKKYTYNLFNQKSNTRNKSYSKQLSKNIINNVSPSNIFNNKSYSNIKKIEINNIIPKDIVKESNLSRNKNTSNKNIISNTKYSSSNNNNNNNDKINNINSNLLNLYENNQKLNNESLNDIDNEMFNENNNNSDNEKKDKLEKNQNIKNNITKKEQFIYNSNKNNNSILNFNNIAVQVVYTKRVNIIHKFVRFKVKKHFANNIQNLVFDYYNELMINNIKLYEAVNLKQDLDLNNEYSSKVDCYDKYYTLALVYDFYKDKNINFIAKIVNSNLENISKISDDINNYLSEDHVLNSELEIILSKWRKDFVNKFSYILDKSPCFLEIRPIIFYSNIK